MPRAAFLPTESSSDWPGGEEPVSMHVWWFLMMRLPWWTQSWMDRGSSSSMASRSSRGVTPIPGRPRFPPCCSSAAMSPARASRFCSTRSQGSMATCACGSREMAPRPRCCVATIPTGVSSGWAGSETPSVNAAWPPRMCSVRHRSVVSRSGSSSSKQWPRVLRWSPARFPVTRKWHARRYPMGPPRRGRSPVL